MDNKNLEKLLLTVQKPGRYSGGEINSVIKDKSKIPFYIEGDFFIIFQFRAQVRILY